MELPSEFPSLPTITDPVFGGTGPGIDIGRPVTTGQTQTSAPTQAIPTVSYEEWRDTGGIGGPVQYNDYVSRVEWRNSPECYGLGCAANPRGFTENPFPDVFVRPTVTAAINPTGTGGAQVSGIFPTEEIVPNVGGFFSNIGASLGESFGGLINDIFQTDQSWDQWGAGLGTVADILAVTGVIPGGAAGHYPTGWQPQPDPHRPLNVPLPPTPIWGGVPPPWTQPQAPAPTQPLQPYGGIPMPHVPTSIPVAFPGGAPVQQAAFPMQITPGGGGGQIRPAAHCSTSLPSRVDIPTVDARGNTRFTTFKNMGRPLLWSGDLAASKRVRKVAAKARRAKGR